MQFKRRLLTGLFAIVSVVAANSEVIPLAAGWQADVFDSSIVSINVDVVGPDFLVIEISKDFLDPPGVGGVFPANLIDFQQIAADADTVPRIIIADETVTNLTGVDWTDYHWNVFDSGDAWFNVPLSDFGTEPFANHSFSDPGNLFNDPDKATDIDADGGVVASGASFFPGGAAGDGNLVIDVDLSRSSPLSFTFKQFPTPEPASFVLLSLCGLIAIRRR